MATLLTLDGTPSPHISASAGSLVVLVRCRGGVLLAADSRLNDPLAGAYHDGVEKIYADGPFAWFLTGHSSYVAYDADTRKQLARVDLGALMTRIGTRSDAGSALELVRRMATDAAEAVTHLGRMYGIKLGAPLAEAAVLGVVRHADEMALARLKVDRQGRSLDVELIPVARIPRLGVFGNDRVYRAIKGGDPRFDHYRHDPHFRNVWEPQQDPARAEATDFAKWLISLTSEKDKEFGRSDHPVGGSPWLLFLTTKDSVWLARP